MKKTLLFASAIIMLAGCAKNEVSDGSESSLNQVRVAPDAGKQDSRGTVATTTSMTNFDVFSYTYSSALSPTSFLSANQKSEVTRTGADAWISATPIFWREGVNHIFFAVSPKASEATSGLVTSAQTDAPMSFDYTLNTDAKLHNDLLVGNAFDEIKKSEAVAIPFKHVTTRLNLSAVLSGPAANGARVFISNAKILGSDEYMDVSAYPTSKFYSTLKYNMLNSATVGEWDYTDAVAEVGQFSIDEVLNSVEPDPVLTGSFVTPSVEISETKVSLFTAGEYLYLIPPNGVTGIDNTGTIRIQLTYNVVNAAGQVSTLSPTLSLPASTMKQGVAYNVTFTIGVKSEVKLSASIEDWNTPSTDDNTDLEVPSIISASASGADIIAAIAKIDAISKSNVGVHFYTIYVNELKPATGTIDLSTALTPNMKNGDKIKLTFKSAAPATRADELIVTPPTHWGIVALGADSYVMSKQTPPAPPAE